MAENTRFTPFCHKELVMESLSWLVVLNFGPKNAKEQELT